MAGSIFGKNFTVTTFGESHGAAIGAVIDGCPSGMHLSEEDIQKYLDRRKPDSLNLLRREMNPTGSRSCQVSSKERQRVHR